MPKISFPVFLWIWNYCEGFSTPTLHLRIAYWLNQNWQKKNQKLLLLSFRHSGKSSIIGIFCAWLLFCNRDLRILVIAANYLLANKMVKTTKRIIEKHPMTRSLLPNGIGEWSAREFTVTRDTVLRDPSMSARGIQSNITGLRADVIICDDVEVPNNCNTSIKRALLRDRLREIDYVLTPAGLQLFVGTPHTYYSIYANECRKEKGEERAFMSDFSRLELPILDEYGNSQWPEKFSQQIISKIRSRSGPNKFEAQMMLRPISIDASRLCPERLQPYSEDLIYRESNQDVLLMLAGRRLVSASCWWDPSYGSPGVGDSSVIAAVFTDDAGEYWLHRINYLTHEPEISVQVDEATQMCRHVVDFVDKLYLPSICLETNGLGRFLPSLLRRELAKRGVYCSVIERSPSISKDVRIVDAFDAILAANRLHAHQSVWKTPFIEEMREWRPGNRCRDDGLDAVAGCLLTEPVRIPRYPRTSSLEKHKPGAWRAGSTCVIVEDECVL